MKKCFIGIDPGKSNGAIAYLFEDGQGAWMTSVSEFSKNAEFEIDMELKEFIQGFNCVAGIEKQQTMPRNGKMQNFKLGENFGMMRGMLIANNIKFIDPTAKIWQKLYSIKKGKNETYDQHKNKLKAKAKMYFPNEKVTLATADALLIANYVKTYDP